MGNGERCERCGNSYDRVLKIRSWQDDQEHVFDSFECAIASLAPTCEHCGCRVIGHGVESDDRIFCCAHCARSSGVKGLADSTDGDAAAATATAGIAPTRPPAES